MRRSTRLSASETLEKLKNEEFIKLASDEIEKEDEYVELKDVFETKIPTKSPKNTGKRGRGRPKKSAPKFEDENEIFKENENTYSAEFSSIPELESDADSVMNDEISSSKSPKKQTKKKFKRAGGYVPPLETNIKDVTGNILLSREGWVKFLKYQSSQIKRSNRRYKTVMMNLENETNIRISPLISSCNEIETNIPRKSPLKLIHGNISHDLIDHSYSIDGKVTLYNSGSSITCLCFCKCPQCIEHDSNVLIFVASLESISVVSVEVSNESGIKSLNTLCRIFPPKSEFFKSICSQGSVLSLSTNKSLYFFNCDSIHQQSENRDIVLCESKTSPTITDISCHSWRGNNVAVGTLSGRFHIFNPVTMNEILQLSIAPNCAIYSVDWCDDCAVVICGSFSKIFSIDLRDPFVIETVVSTLATLPKVVWSHSLNSVLFADGENHARRLEKTSFISNNINHSHQPLGTFSSMVHEMASSSSHNIVATASSSGSIQLSWMPEESGYGVEFEKKVLSIQKCTEETSFKLITDSEYIKFHVIDTLKLYPSDQACTSVCWCPNKHFPGLLAGGYRNGLLVLMSADQFFI